jgi:hypothetical protein
MRDDLEIETIVRRAIASGAISPANADALRELARLDPARAREYASGRPAPAPRPSVRARPVRPVRPMRPVAATAAIDPECDAALAANGVDPTDALRYARVFGAKAPRATFRRLLLEEHAAAGLDPGARRTLASHGLDADQALRYARVFGAKDPARALHIAVVGDDDED